jgi:c-di-GMP-binding flagellar brake protein YcgR
MAHEGVERRKYERVKANFIVSYRVLDEINDMDISQTKNMGLGGMLLTTSRQFTQGMNLAVEIRLPFERNPIMLIGKVVDSMEITQDLIYDTRLEFLAIDENHRGIIRKTIKYYISKEKELNTP